MPERYQVNITEPAQEQLREIRNYIANTLQNPIAAKNVLELLSKNILSLSELPHRVMLTPEEPWKSRGIRRMPVKGYLVYFWIDEESRAVHIIAVVYGRRDQKMFLAETAPLWEKTGIN